MLYDCHKLLEIPVEGARLTGEIIVPSGARSLVLFSHGSGSSRLSTRNTFVADVLHQHSIGTFLFDLLTPEEDAVYAHRFDIPLLTDRLVAATDFLDALPRLAHLTFGYFGASTGAASALGAAARRPDRVLAVVSRGGRPDLAGPALAHVMAATLLIVGGLDTDVLALNRMALEGLHGTKYLAVVPGATHLFEEPGTLKQAAELAAAWFSKYLQPIPQTAT
ncbi:hydrolase [Hymenobacter sedentarius]|uniref:Hydrolase n=1 Tax=Hymenobacter sedentarius TaxID=1411621 RepID=A0A0U4BS06_9BACT|nr:alpha/beta hydrolase [Hymenobacter sedentarius]ALW86474.1 hydrolase [Hymenobacter sedentarius]